MKKSVLIALLAALIVMAFSACDMVADKNLPANDSLLQVGSWFSIQDGDVVMTVMKGQRADGSYYAYVKNQGESSCADGVEQTMIGITAGQFEDCVLVIRKAVQKHDLPVVDTCDFIFTTQQALGYARISHADNTVPYYVYSIANETLQQGTGVYRGDTTLGLIQFTQENGKMAYIAIDR